MKTYLTHARIVLLNEVVDDAALLLEDGMIRAINPLSSESVTEIDLAGQTLMPGLIDLHGDALEKEVEPRPNVFFPLHFAMSQADKRNAQAGISTSFHALSFAHEEFGLRNTRITAELARTINAYRPYGLVDNRVHGRYEITDDIGLPILLDLLEDGGVHLVSLMDHTPGQGQFKDFATYRDYLSRTYKKDAGETIRLVQRKFDQARSADQRIDMLLTQAHKYGVQIASHDDDSPQRVATMARLGASVSEFPINLDTARTARALGLWTVLGAPNLLRGKSQSGSMRALQAVQAGVADCLCSDYAPAALLAAVFRLPELTGCCLVDAVRLATANPARAANLNDRGEIAPGKRADLIAIQHMNGLPHVTSLWIAGRLTYQSMLPNGLS